MSYRAALETLQGSILEGDPNIAAPLVKAKAQLSPQEQVNLYIEGYLLRLGKAVQADYPCLIAYLGLPRMEALSQAYARATPSRSYNLDFYPFGFAAYLKQAGVSQEALELAELESAIAEVFLLPCSMPLEASVLAALDPETLDTTTFTLRPASRLLAFTHDVEAALQDFKRGDPIPVILQQPTYLYVLRHQKEVRRHRLDETEYRLLTQLAAGKDLNTAIEATFSISHQDEDVFLSNVMASLSLWIREGFFASPSHS